MFINYSLYIWRLFLWNSLGPEPHFSDHSLAGICLTIDFTSMDLLGKDEPHVPRKNPGIFSLEAKIQNGWQIKFWTRAPLQSCTMMHLFRYKSSTRIPILTLVWHYGVIFTQESKMAANTHQISIISYGL